MTAPKVIVVATDFSPSAEAALDHALALAQTLKARVFLVHTYQLPLIGFPDGVVAASAELASRIINQAQDALSASVAKRAGSGVEIVPILKQADPRDGLLEVASEVSADLIVMGTHGRRGIARALIGSVAESLVRASPVPVLTVHAA